MGFSSKQVAALRRNVDGRHIRSRQSNGRELSYLEGWYVISQAKRIFCFDGWSRETLESKCVLSRENRGYFTAVYTAKVRLTVQANGTTIVREGHGTGEGRGEFPGEVHDTALKAAETDATKRALATFGRPFGLELYRGGQAAKQGQARTSLRLRTGERTAAAGRGSPNAVATEPTQLGAALKGAMQPPPLTVETAPELSPVAKFARDDTTPIPRPSTYYGREHYHDIREENGAVLAQMSREDAGSSADMQAGVGINQPVQEGSRQLRPDSTTLVPPGSSAERIDKSALHLGEPKRIRDKEHLKFVSRQPCLVCGRQPADAHHLRFAQPRALGLKVSDEFTVPLCRTHHRNLHQAGNELIWWEKTRIEPLPVAGKLWETTHPRAASRAAVASNANRTDVTETVTADETKPIAAAQS
jgi:hypothetical protein